jgi:hypothetical protein
MCLVTFIYHRNSNCGKNVYSVIQARPATRSRRNQVGQRVCQIHRPITTGSTNKATKSWRKMFQLRNRRQDFGRSSRLKSRAAPKTSHKRVRTVKARMLISKSVFMELSQFEMILTMSIFPNPLVSGTRLQCVCGGIHWVTSEERCHILRHGHIRFTSIPALLTSSGNPS